MATRTGLVTLALLVGLSLQQQDPLDKFCRRHGQQTTVIDRRLYIDGGFIIYDPPDPNPLNYSNNGLQYANLDVDHLGMPQVSSNLSKPENAPDVNGGILWPDRSNKLFYLYGGEYSEGNPRDFSLWLYDTIYDTWNVTSESDSQNSIQRASWGAGVTAQDRAVGYYYGGWLSNASVPSWGSQPPLALSTFLQYNMLENKWRNTSGPDTTGRAEGAMVYIPSGDAGMLAYFGGLQSLRNNSTITGQPMDEILIYDIAGSQWYTEKATGEIPPARRRFCAGVTWSKDQSTYNIYMYGGLAAGKSGGYPDSYILTLPTFTWIKWWPEGNNTAGAPKHSMSCDVVDKAQMIILGGYNIRNVSNCDVPTIYSLHNMYLGKQNPENAEWGKFRSNLTEYDVPSEVIDVVGGTAAGNAERKEPKNGFVNSDLKTYFQRTYTEPVREPTRAIPTPTSSSDSKPVPAGTIAGAVVGAVAGVALIAGFLFWFFRVHKKKTAAAPADQNPAEAIPQTPQLDGYPAGKPKPPSAHHERNTSELENTAIAELPSPWPSPNNGEDGTWTNSANSHTISAPSSPTSLPPYSTSHNGNGNNNESLSPGAAYGTSPTSPEARWPHV